MTKFSIQMIRGRFALRCSVYKEVSNKFALMRECFHLIRVIDDLYGRIGMFTNLLVNICAPALPHDFTDVVVLLVCSVV